MATASEYPRFIEKFELEKLKDLSAPGYFPPFAGTNGEHAGVKICPPYRFDISGLQKLGLNSLRIDVTNTLFREQRDKLLNASPLEPSGLLGPVLLRYGQSEK